MAVLAEILTELSVSFATTTNLRVLLPRVATGLAPLVPLIEAELIALDRSGSVARIAVFAPAGGRTWQGERSARFLHRRAVDVAGWSAQREPARVALDRVEARLELPIGRSAMLSLAFSTDISRDHEANSQGEDETAIWVEALAGHCRRLGQLHDLARLSRSAHRQISAYASLELTDMTVVAAELEPGPAPELGLEPPEDTEISLMTVDQALRACIRAALRQTHGRIYGDGGAAELLGLKPSTLQSKMTKLGIERREFTE